MRTIAALIVALTGLPGLALADQPQIVEAAARQQSGGWRFDVTVRHADTGWDHYADAWAVFSPDGDELGRRELLHPHTEEQPFTRSLDGVPVPDDVASVTVRAHDPVHGWGEPTTVELPR